MRRPGFTLLELIVTMSIAGLMFMIVGGIFLAQGRYLAIEDAINETQYHAFQALDAAGLYTSSAKRVVSSMTINGQPYTTSTSTVILELPSIDSNGTVLGNTFDYVAIGKDPTDPTKFIYDIDAAVGSVRLNGKFSKASLIDKVIFRYNTVDPASATAIELYVRTAETIRGRTITTPLGKIYYLHSS
ncbi:MAG: type II secretion system protein [Patescibacteria group bacterium]|nr:MAG: type II secretion system protein [Patescibacteria group bacterium]